MKDELSCVILAFMQESLIGTTIDVMVSSLVELPKKMDSQKPLATQNIEQIIHRIVFNRLVEKLENVSVKKLLAIELLIDSPNIVYVKNTKKC